MRKPPSWIKRVIENGEDVSFGSSGLPHRVRASITIPGTIHVAIGWGEFDIPFEVAEAISDIVVALRKKGKT